jgi:hypothetical protein
MLNKIEFNILYYSRRTDVWMGRRRLAQVLVGRLVELNEMDYASTRESRERESSSVRARKIRTRWALLVRPSISWTAQ